MSKLPSPPRQPGVQPAPRRGGLLGFLGGGGLALGLTLAVVVGLQLGAMPWRFRKEIWQLQGAFAGGLVGVLVGWSVGRSQRQPDEDGK